MRALLYFSNDPTLKTLNRPDSLIVDFPIYHTFILPKVVEAFAVLNRKTGSAGYALKTENDLAY